MLKHRFIYYILFVQVVFITLLLTAKSAIAQGVNTFPLEGFTYSLADSTDTAAIAKRIRTAADLMKTQHSDTAFNILQNTLKISLQANYAEGICQSLIGIGRVYLDKGEYEKSITTFQRAVPYCFLLKDKATLINAYVDISVAYAYENDLENNFKYLYWASLIAEKYKTENLLSNIYNNMGATAGELGKRQQALFYLNKAEKIAVQQNDSVSIAATMLNKGEISMFGPDWEKALSYYTIALKIGEQKKLPNEQCTALLNMGAIYMNNNKPQQALQYLLKAQGIKGGVNPYYVNGVNTLLGNAYLHLHDYKNAEQYLTKALDGDKKMRSDKGLVELHNMLAETYGQTGQYQQAYEHQRKSYLLTDSLTKQKSTANANQLEIKYRTAQKDNEIIQKQLQINNQESHLKEKNIWISGISAVSFLLIGLSLSLYRSNRHKQEIGQLKAMVDGEERERTRIARELHDGIGGMLVAMKMNLSAATNETSSEIRNRKLNDLMEMLQDTATEVRKTAHNLMPDVLIRYDLKKALELYTENINTANEVELDLQFIGDIGQLDKNIELVIYRITQELIQNIVKHAHATHAAIQLTSHNGKLKILVEDNGTGFDVAAEKGGYGLQNLKFRVHALEGRISIMSVKGGNTTIHIEFDIEKLKNGY